MYGATTNIWEYLLSAMHVLLLLLNVPTKFTNTPLHMVFATGPGSDVAKATCARGRNHRENLVETRCRLYEHWHQRFAEMKPAVLAKLVRPVLYNRENNLVV